MIQIFKFIFLVNDKKDSLHSEIIHGQAGVVDAEMDSTLQMNGCHDLDIKMNIHDLLFLQYLGHFIATLKTVTYLSLKILYGDIVCTEVTSRGRDFAI